MAAHVVDDSATVWFEVEPAEGFSPGWPWPGGGGGYRFGRGRDDPAGGERAAARSSRHLAPGRRSGDRLRAGSRLEIGHP